MVKNDIVVNRDMETVWSTIEEEFCTVFKCKPSELAGRVIKTKAKSYYGDPIQVSQQVTEYVPGKTIAIESVRDSDVVTSRYTVEPATAGATKISLALQGKNEKSVLRSWNYTLMSWPVLRGGTKKRLKRQLMQLKKVIESKGV